MKVTTSDTDPHFTKGAIALTMSKTVSGRIHQRIPIKLPVTVKGAGDELYLSTENISLGGAFLVIDESLCAVGDEVTLGISLPSDDGEEPVRAQIRGVIVHAVPPLGVGVEFNFDEDVAGEELLRRFVKRLQSLESALG